MSNLFDRVKMTVSGTPGSGTITLGSAVTDASNGDYLSFANASVPTGVTVSYVAIDGHNWGKGRGIYTSAGTTLSRDAAEVTWNGSTVGNTPISLSSATVVFLTAIAWDLPQGLYATASGSSNTLTLSDIPQVPGDLEITVVGRHTGTGNVSANLRVNGLSTNIYNINRDYGGPLGTGGDGDMAASSFGALHQFLNVCGTDTAAGYVAGSIMRILNYSGASFYKMINGYGSNVDSTNGPRWFIGVSGQVQSTAAVTSVSVATASNNWAAGSILSARVIPY
jgi:hypothetical protein